MLRRQVFDVASETFLGHCANLVDHSDYSPASAFRSNGTVNHCQLNFTLLEHLPTNQEFYQ